MLRKAIIVTLALAFSAPVQAKIQFAPYDGPLGVQQGEGGSKEVYNGIEYWRAGSPPRPYRQIGFVFDQRREQGDGLDDSIKSARLAKLIKEHGGDGAILRGSEVAGDVWEMSRQIQYIIFKYVPAKP